MGCGGHFLGHLARETLGHGRHGQGYDYGYRHDHRGSPGNSCGGDARGESAAWTEARRRYAKGEVDRASFQRLRELEEMGSLTLADVESVAGEMQVPSAFRSPSSTPAGREVENAETAVVKRRLKQVADARTESARVLREVEEKMADLNRRGEELEEQARHLVHQDEDRARELLTRRRQSQAQGRNLEQRAEELRDDLERLQSLESELDIKLTELRAVASSGALAGLELDIKEVEWS